MYDEVEFAYVSICCSQIPKIQTSNPLLHSCSRKRIFFYPISQIINNVIYNCLIFSRIVFV